jgi:hypothetical protein
LQINQPTTNLFNPNSGYKPSDESLKNHLLAGKDILE